MNDYLASPRLIITLAAVVACLLPTESIGQESRTDVPAARVIDIHQALPFESFPVPENVSMKTVMPNGLYFQTPDEIETVKVTVIDELLKRGFTPGDTQPTRSASITIQVQDRPATLFLTSAWKDRMTHVMMYHHQGIDVSQVPRVKPNGPVDERVDQVSYTTTIGVIQGQQMLSQELSARNIPVARTSLTNGVAQRFTWNGIRFVVNVERVQDREFEYPNEGKPEYTRVSILTTGSTDVSQLPMPGKKENLSQPYNSVFGSHKFIVEQSAADAIEACRSALQKSGWTPVRGFRDAIADQQALFINRGTLLQVDASSFDNGRVHVTYNVSILPFDIPGGIATRLTTVDTAMPHLFFVTAADVEAIQGFYQGHLADLGWRPVGTQFERTAEKQYRNLYRGPHYQPVLLEVTNKEPGTTWVELKPTSMESVAASNSAESKSSDTTVEASPDSQADAAEPMRTAQSDETQGSTELPVDPAALSGNLEALMQKQLQDALEQLEPGEADEARKMIEATLKEAFGGNSTEPEVPMVERQAAGEPFGDESPASDDATDNPTEEPSPTPQASKDRILAAEFPVPAGAVRVTRDFGMITFGVPAVKEAAEKIDQSLTQLGWKRRGEQMIESDMAIMKFQRGTGTINVSLIHDDRRDPPVHGVVQGDGIQFPDDEFGGGEFEDMSFPEEESEFEGLQLPPRIEDVLTIRSQFRTEMSASIESDLKSMQSYFLEQAKQSGWKLAIQPQLKDGKSVSNFKSDRGELEVTLETHEAEVGIQLAIRVPASELPAAFAPKPNKARLILANASERPVTIRINSQVYKLGPEQGAQVPNDGIQLDLAPGQYEYSILGDGREQQSDKLKLEANGTWGMIILPEQGHMADRMY